jgi:hypothetical protein
MKRGLRKYVGQTVIVHQNGPSLQGVLLHAYRDCLVLGHASSLDDKEDLAGELVVPMGPGVWMQKA